jgi:hypothetical protein
MNTRGLAMAGWDVTGTKSEESRTRGLRIFLIAWVILLTDLVLVRIMLKGNDPDWKHYALSAARDWTQTR